MARPCAHSTHDGKTNFCPTCGQRIHDLSGMWLAGFIGVQHSTSENIERFLRTGDPTYV